MGLVFDTHIFEVQWQAGCVRSLTFDKLVNARDVLQRPNGQHLVHQSHSFKPVATMNGILQRHLQWFLDTP